MEDLANKLHCALKQPKYKQKIAGNKYTNKKVKKCINAATLTVIRNNNMSITCKWEFQEQHLFKKAMFAAKR